MSDHISPASKLVILVKREFWEQRIPFLLVPICCVVLVVVTFGFSVFIAYFKDELAFGNLLTGYIQSVDETAADALSRFADAPAIYQERFWEQFYGMPGALILMLLWALLAYYFLMTLYQQRKVGSHE